MTVVLKKIRGKCLDEKRRDNYNKFNTSQQTQNICITFVKRGPTFSMLDQHCTNVVQMLCAYYTGM